MSGSAATSGAVPIRTARQRRRRGSVPGRLRWLAVVLPVMVLFPSIERAAAEEEPALSRIAFGSCCRQDRPQPIWDAVVATSPQLFVFLGDNIYGDSADVDVLRAKYQQLLDQSGYQRLQATCPVVATWDDHDYGVNDGGVEYPSKRASQQLFLEVFQAPADDPRRSREGVYSAQVHGPPGRRVQILLLDTRYFRSPLQTGYDRGEPGEGRRGMYVPEDDPATTLLGPEQWNWLAEQLRVPAEVRIIGSSIQALTNEHGWEKWGNFPHERTRLLRLIRDSNAGGVLLLSGDRHLAEISRLPADDELGVGYPLYDVTSSSLNTPSGNFTAAGVRFANEPNRYRLGNQFFETNFGLIDIDWTATDTAGASDPLLRLQVRDSSGGVVLQQRVRLSELQPRPPAASDAPR